LYCSSENAGCHRLFSLQANHSCAAEVIALATQTARVHDRIIAFGDDINEKVGFAGRATFGSLLDD
jgi:hypothetical protein